MVLIQRVCVGHCEEREREREKTEHSERVFRFALKEEGRRKK